MTITVKALKAKGDFQVYSLAHATINDHRFSYSGNIDSLVRGAVEAGGKAGDKIVRPSSYGLKEYKLVASQERHAVKGLWAKRVWLPNLI